MTSLVNVQRSPKESNEIPGKAGGVLQFSEKIVKQVVTVQLIR